MLRVLALRRPFKVCNGIVTLVAVLVIYLWFVVRVRDERFRYKPMHKVTLTVGVNPAIAVGIMQLRRDFNDFVYRAVLIDCKLPIRYNAAFQADSSSLNSSSTVQPYSFAIATSLSAFGSASPFSHWHTLT
jgi:hypothetical protein